MRFPARSARLRTSSLLLLLAACGQQREAPEKVALQGCRARYDNLQRWIQRYSRFPVTEEELEQAARRKEKDPWGNAYFIDGFKSRQYVVWSNGPDGEENTEDDIRYPPGE